MRSLFLIFFTVISIFNAFPQVPQAINYQGILRNTDGQAIPNKDIVLRLSILSFKVKADIGQVEYIEEIKKTT